MSISATINKTMSVGGVTFNQTGSTSADAAIVHDVSVAAAKEGTLSTRTDADTGVFTLDDSGHNIGNGDRVDVYWTTEAGVVGCRRGMAASGVTGAEMTLDGGSGDDLPSEDQVVQVAEPVALDVSVLGTNVQAILLYAAKRALFTFIDDATAEAYYREVGAAKSWEWEEGNGVDNPITGDQIETVYVSHEDTTAATLKIGVLYNN